MACTFKTFFTLCQAAVLLGALQGCAASPHAQHTAKSADPDPIGEFIQALPQLNTVTAQLDSIRNDVVVYAMSMVGVLYKRGGNSADTGLDCSGLVKLVYGQVAGISLPRTAVEQSALGQTISIDTLTPGDLVFYNTLKRPFSHVGIYVGNGQFVHSPSAGKKVRLANMNDRYWETRFEGARRVVTPPN